MGKGDMFFLVFRILVCLVAAGLFFGVPIWVLSGRAYICDPESHRPAGVQERVNGEAVIQEGFGGY